MSRGAASTLSRVAPAILAAALCLAAPAVATSHGAAPAGASPAESPPVLRLADRGSQLPCARVEGEIVVLVDPQRGVLVLSTRELAGSERVGRVTDGTARFSFPGLRMKELVVDGAAGDGRALDLWGRIAAAGDVSTPDCFELSWREGESDAELLARVAARLGERRKGPST